MFLQDILIVGEDWITRGGGIFADFENKVGLSK